MSTRAQLSEAINRLLPGEQNKRIRLAILEAATYSGSRTDQLRQSIDEANRVRTGLLVDGTLDITSTTNADLQGFAWVIDFQIFQLDGVESITIDAPDADFPRPEIFVGLDDGTVVYRAGTIDEEGNAQEPTYNPATEVLLRAITRNPDNSADEQDSAAGADDNVKKSVTGNQTIQSDLTIAKLAQGQFDYLRSDPNGKLQVVRGDKVGVRTTIQGSVGWARAIRINCNFSQQLNYGMTLELSAVESNDYQTAKLTFYLRFNSSGVLQDSSLLLFGKVTPARYKIVKISTDVYELWLHHFTSLTLYVWRPLFSFGGIDRYTLYNREAITSLPGGDQLDFVDANDLSEILSDITALETWAMDLDNQIQDHEERIEGLEMNSGPSLPPGGTTGQVLKKQSAADGDADWEDESGGASGDYLTLVTFSSVISMTGNFKSVHSQTGAIAYTLSSSSPSTNFANRTEHYITANNTGGKPTFSASFVKMLDNWNNANNARNLIIFKILPNGLCAYWIYDVTQI